VKTSQVSGANVIAKTPVQLFQLDRASYLATFGQVRGSVILFSAVVVVGPSCSGQGPHHSRTAGRRRVPPPSSL
jgi:hypothetical protein